VKLCQLKKSTMTEHEPSGVRITNVMIYEKLMEINENQIAMRVELNQLSDHEPRIRFLEKKLWMFMGGSGILGAFVYALISQYLGV